MSFKKISQSSCKSLSQQYPSFLKKFNMLGEEDIITLKTSTTSRLTNTAIVIAIRVCQWISKSYCFMKYTLTAIEATEIIKQQTQNMYRVRQESLSHLSQRYNFSCFSDLKSSQQSLQVSQYLFNSVPPINSNIYEKIMAPNGSRVSLMAGDSSFKSTEVTDKKTIIAQISVKRRVILYYLVKNKETVL